MNRPSSPRARRALLAAAALATIAAIALVLLIGRRAPREGVDGAPQEAAGAQRPDASLRVADDAGPPSREAAPEASAPPVVAGPAPGVLRGVVVAGPDREAVPHVTVALLHRSWPLRVGTTDEAGRFEFLDLVPAAYVPCVDPRSLPEGVIPPWGQIDGPSQGDPGFGAAEVEIEAGVEREVELRCFLAARIVGRVVDRDGSGVAGATVRAQSTRAGYQGVNRDLGIARGGGIERVLFPTQDDDRTSSEPWRTDESGYFELVDVYASTYEILVGLSAAADAGLRSLTLPQPVTVEVAEGAVVDAGDLRLDAGDRTVRGVVLDAWDDQPLAGLTVVCYDAAGDQSNEYATARTDGSGRFVIERLPAVPVKFLVEPRGAMRGTGANVLAQHAEALQVDLASAPPNLELRPIRVWSARPFELRATLAGAAGIDVDPKEWVVEVICPGHRGRMPCARLAEWDAERRWFSWACDPPHEDVIVRLRRGAGQRALEGSDPIDQVEVSPQPNELLEIQLQIR